MGHRLHSFLGTALPQHPEYNRIALAPQRAVCQRAQEWLINKLAEIALYIDEQELNIYMDRQFEPEPNIEESSSSAHSTEDAGNESWEDFTGWVCNTKKLNVTSPYLTDTDTSSSDWTKEYSSESEVENDDVHRNAFGPVEFHFELPPNFPDGSKVILDDDNFPDPDLSGLDDTCDDEDEDEEDRINAALLCVLNEPVLATPFLKHIACQDVQFESDSEAVDSWAQDDDSVAFSGSSGTALTCDPARIAFRELMSKLPSRRGSLRTLRNQRDIPPLSPAKRFERHECETGAEGLSVHI